MQKTKLNADALMYACRRTRASGVLACAQVAYDKQLECLSTMLGRDANKKDQSECVPAIISSISSSSVVLSMMCLYFAGVSRYPSVDVGTVAAWLMSVLEGTHPLFLASGGSKDGEGARPSRPTGPSVLPPPLTASDDWSASSSLAAVNGFERPGTVRLKLNENPIMGIKSRARGDGGRRTRKNGGAATIRLATTSRDSSLLNRRSCHRSKTTPPTCHRLRDSSFSSVDLQHTFLLLIFCQLNDSRQM